MSECQHDKVPRSVLVMTCLNCGWFDFPDAGVDGVSDAIVNELDTLRRFKAAALTLTTEALVNLAMIAMSKEKT